MRELRDWCERGGGVPASEIGDLFGQPTEQVMGRLEGEGLIQPVETAGKANHGTLWSTTHKGNALAIAKFIKPISRKKAQTVLADFLDRVAEVNMPESGWLHGVAKVELYGSFADPLIDPVGDVDLQVFTFRRWKGDTQEMWDQLNAFIERRGANPRSFMEGLTYPERSFQSYLKGRSHVLSIAWDVDQRDQLGINPVLLFETEPFQDLG